MVTAVLVLHILVCISIVVVVLLQQGKGAEVGAVFGGSSQTVFGASGAGNMLTKATYTLAAVFFATSLILAYSSTHRVNGSIFNGKSFPSAPAPMKAAPPAANQPARPAPPNQPPGH
ncbi:MAG TPA: preprotein translocase subunit SecG [Candidatus Binataceae bacterium]|jgi:preprotein translocase subunit SecG|nr:preprotein translocase subunit SecG [Candidatus Binataceae bacterium]